MPLVSWTVNHGRLVKRDMSSNHTSGSANTTQGQNLTTTGIPTVATTYRRPFWSTRRRNTASPVPFDHLGFPIIPNSPRGTRRPIPPRTERNANSSIENSGKDRDGNLTHSREILAELRERGTGPQSSSSKLPTSTQSNFVELSSNASHTANSIWIAVFASLVLSAFICLTVHWARLKRRGKLMIAPSGNKGQRSAAFVFKAWHARQESGL